LKQSKPKKLKPDYMPVMERMQLDADFLRLCFILSGKKIWFQVDPHTGIIEQINNETDEQYHFHFALKKVGKARGTLHRGRNDILVAFVKNAMRYCSKNDPHYLNDNAHRETIWKKLDHLTNQFMEKLDSDSVNKARKASGRHAIAWEIYGILKRYPGHCTGYQIGKLNREQLDIMGKWFPSFADDPAEESSTLYTDTQDWERYL
jgi:hypothetical protein